MTDMKKEDLRKEYKKNGYITFKNFFSKKKMRKVKSDLFKLSKKRKKDIFLIVKIGLEE